MNQLQPETLIESILFFKGESVSIGLLSEILEKNEEEIEGYLNKLKENLSGRGIQIVKQDKTVELATAPEAHEVIKKMVKKNLTSKLGKAGMEVLTIILYRGPIVRSDIDFIRGVNSGSTVRNLLIRGLVNKKISTDNRILYEPSTKLLRHLGVCDVSELPEYGRAHKELDQFYQDAVE